MTIKIRQNYNRDNSYFGGLMHDSDFNIAYKAKHQRESYMAKRIVSDWNFDKRCQQNTKFRKRLEHIDAL